MLAFDFWTVKNISGRLLVGLRWWSSVKDDGKTEWIFESLHDMNEISALDSRVFWGALYATPVVWALLLLVVLLRLNFQYVPVVIVALAMSTANLLGYLRCSSDAQNKLKGMVRDGMHQASMSALGNSSVQGFFYNAILSLAGASNSQSSSSSGGTTRSQVEV